jgi:Carboxyl transferase domain/Biotin-requiring enzyme
MYRVSVALATHSSDGSHNSGGASLMPANRRLPPVDVTLVAPFGGTVVAIPAPATESVAAGQPVVVIEAMKMEHEVVADRDATVARVTVAVGETVTEGQTLAVLAGANGPGPLLAAGPPPSTQPGDRDDLRQVLERHDVGLDHRRPEATAKRHEQHRRTARENLGDLLDADSFVEYGPLVIAAQERRRALQELMERTPADGLVGGVGRIAGDPVIAMSYDYTVLAGTQGMRNHQKKDRLFELAERRRLPVVLFAEGGGGRPGDVDMPIISGLDCRAFQLFARLSGLVPLVGIASGYCFAGNAALLGCCDVVIATEDASIGMGGPAMIEGGGLGTYDPAEVGPIDVQYANGGQALPRLLRSHPTPRPPCPAGPDPPA